MRSSLHILRDPAVAREIPEPAIRIGRAGGRKFSGSRRARNLADRAGHHLLRRRPRASRWIAAAARAAGANRGFTLDSVSLLLSESHHAKIAGDDCGASASCEVSGYSTAACEPKRSGAHEAGLERGGVFENAG